MASTTNYGWSTPDDTSLVKDGASAIRTLGSSIDTTTKALNPSTTLGDIEYRSSTANTNTRLGIGSTGQVLTVSSGVPAWQTISAGGMTLISETTASAISSLSLSSIPSTYKQLLLVWEGIYHSVTSTAFAIRLNNDSTSKYDNKFWGAENGTVAFNQVNGDDICYTGSTTIFPFGWSITSTTNALLQANGFLLIDNYASASKYKDVNFNFAFGKGPGYGGIGTCVYTSTSAITSIDVYRSTGAGTFSNAANTSIRLYGIS